MTVTCGLIFKGMRKLAFQQKHLSIN